MVQRLDFSDHQKRMVLKLLGNWLIEGNIALDEKEELDCYWARTDSLSTRERGRERMREGERGWERERDREERGLREWSEKSL